MFLRFMLPDYKMKNAEVDGCAATAGAANVTRDRLSKVVGQQLKGQYSHPPRLIKNISVRFHLRAC